MTEVYLYNIPDISKEQFNKYLALVSPERQAKIHRLKCRDKQGQALFAALLLRAVLCDRLKVKNDQLHFSATEKGKPYLTDRTDVHFSISHTDGLVAVAVSDREVGIDAETVKPADPKLCQRFFSTAEQDFVTPETEGWLERFYLVWTRKEAYLKYTGEGLSVPLASFSTVSDDRYKTVNFERYTISLYSEDGVMTVLSDKTEDVMNGFIKTHLK